MILNVALLEKDFTPLTKEVSIKNITKIKEGNASDEINGKLPGKVKLCETLGLTTKNNCLFRSITFSIT